MKKSILSALAALALIGGGAMTISVLGGETATAQPSAKAVVDQAITQGLVGETAGGYLKVVSAASPAVQNAVNEINIGRKSVYTRLASQQGVSVEVVATLTGEKQIAKAAPGTKVMNKAGQWMTK